MVKMDIMPDKNLDVDSNNNGAIHFDFLLKGCQIWKLPIFG